MGNNPDISTIRLRSSRSRKRIARTDYEKYLRACIKRQRALQKQKRELPLVPLEKPYQRGYVRFFVLRQDVKQGKQADFFEALLEKINTYQYAENRKFQRKKKRRGKPIPRKQELQSFSQWEWDRVIEKKTFSEKERVYFRKMERFNPKKEQFETFYEFAESWRFELRVKPNMITHYRPLDLDIERELAQLEKIIDDYKNWGIISRKVYCRSYQWWTKDAKYKRTPLKEVTALKIYSSALEIAERLMDSQFY